MRSREMRSYWALALCLAMVAGSVFVLSSCSKPQEEPPAISAPVTPPPAPAAEESEAAESGAVDAESAAVEEESESAATSEQEAVVEVSYGEEIEIADYVVEGKTTIVDFFSEFCPPCVELAPALHELAESSEDINLVVVNINRPDVEGIDWESPVARQFELSSIPHLQVYGPDGTLEAEGDAARAKVEELLP